MKRLLAALLLSTLASACSELVGPVQEEGGYPSPQEAPCKSPILTGSGTYYCP